MAYFSITHGDVSRPFGEECTLTATVRLMDNIADRTSQTAIPDTVGRFRHLFYATNIGAVRTPFFSTRNPIDLPAGIAIVTQLEPDFSAVCHMTPGGALSFATKILEEVQKPFGWLLERTPEHLAKAVQAARDADYEARTARKELP